MAERVEQGEHCQDCGKEYPFVWRADNKLWRRLVGKGEAGLLCPTCFLQLAEQKGEILYWVCDTEAPDLKAGKQARAEVLAACIEHARGLALECTDNPAEAYLWRRAADDFAKLQPTAAALEALLREAEVEGIRWAEGRDIAQITARLNELEKARVIVEKP